MSPVRWVGASKGLARRCAWCQQWHSLADRIRALCGADTTHEMCPSCAEAFVHELDEAS